MLMVGCVRCGSTCCSLVKSSAKESAPASFRLRSRQLSSARAPEEVEKTEKEALGRR